MKKFFLLYLFLLIGFNRFIFAQTPEFKISIDPDTSQFIRRNPQLFWDSQGGFWVTWEEWCEGEYKGYAQRFSATGEKKQKNFSIHGAYRVCEDLSGYIFSLSRIEELNPLDLFIHLNGQIQNSYGAMSPLLTLARFQAPPCPVGFRGENANIWATSDGFSALVYYDDRALLKKFDRSGRISFSLPESALFGAAFLCGKKYLSDPIS